MKRFLFPFLTIAILLGTVATAYAVTMSITDAKSADPGTLVTITGEITAANGNDYTLSDGTDSITVGFGPTWNKAMGLTVGETVTIDGEVDKGKDGTKPAEVDGFKAVKSTGEEVVARTGPGKPPWAGVGGPKGKARGKGVKGAKK